MPICTTFSAFAFLALVICSSAANTWAVLKSADHTWEKHIGIWHDCLSKNCWADVMYWPAFQTAQGFMITAVLCGFLLTTWLFGFFCTSPTLKMHCHFIFIVLSFLTGSSLFIAIMLMVFILEKANAVQNTYYVVLWPFYMLWIALILLVTSCILGIISYKGPLQKNEKVVTVMNAEARQGDYFRATKIKQSIMAQFFPEKTFPNMLHLSKSSLGDNWIHDKEICNAFRDL